MNHLLELASTLSVCACFLFLTLLSIEQKDTGLNSRKVFGSVLFFLPYSLTAPFFSFLVTVSLTCLTTMIHLPEASHSCIGVQILVAAFPWLPASRSGSREHLLSTASLLARGTVASLEPGVDYRSQNKPGPGLCQTEGEACAGQESWQLPALEGP